MQLSSGRRVASAGLIASRSRLVGFEHNDMDDLTRLLEIQAADDKKDAKKAAATRRFLVVEGLYENFGDIAPLDKLVELKFKYKVRLFVEESMSFGVLGATGRGVTEHFGIPVNKIDAIAASMGNALASIGGFVCGRSYLIDHQRLSGAGYCYSASLPPLLAVGAIEALDIIDQRGGLQAKLAANAALFRAAVTTEFGIGRVFALAPGWNHSPVMHLKVVSDVDRAEKERLLRALADAGFDKGLALVLAQYIPAEELHLPDPSIRLVVSAGHTEKELRAAAKTLAKAAETVV